MDEIGGDPGAPLAKQGVLDLLAKGDHVLARIGAKIPIAGWILARYPLSARGLILVLVALALLLLLPPLIYRLLRLMHREAPNFQGIPIPQSYGLVILIGSSLLLLLLAFLLPEAKHEFHTWLLAVIGFGTLGFIDDTWGVKNIKGLRGHIRALLQDHRLTTGLIKAMGGGVLALWLGFREVPASPLQALLVGAVIALSANAINLLDLRPGRAGACFLAAAFLVLIAVRRVHPQTLSPLVFIVLPTLPVWAHDSRARAMMGDTGSNLLGAALGLSLAVLSLPTQGVALLVLIALHVATERISLTKWIETVPPLRALDRLTGVR